MENKRAYPDRPAIVRHSARVLLLNDGKIALIQRIRGGNTYYVFPGGRVEPGETYIQAAIREAREELGLIVQPKREVAQIQHGDIVQHYYLVESTGGLFGSGDGPEMIGQYPPERGTYTAVWLPVQNLPCRDVVPSKLCSWLQAAVKNGWPAGIFYGDD